MKTISAIENTAQAPAAPTGAAGAAAPAIVATAAAAPSADDAEQTAARFVELVALNPAFRHPYRAALIAADGSIERGRLAEAIAEAPAPATFIQTPQDAITTCVGAGVLEQTIFVNGEPYAGSPEDLQADDAIDEEAEISYRVALTDAGRRALAALAPENLLGQLMEDKPQHAAAFLKVLAVCALEGGAPKADIERALAADGSLKVDQRTQVPTVYPAYFTGALEDAGALRWNAATARWEATAAGRAAVA